MSRDEARRELLRHPAGHHISPSRMEDDATCHYRYFLRHVLKVPARETAPATAGRLSHAALELASIHRSEKPETLALPVAGEELALALTEVEASEPVDARALATAREALLRAAPRIDFSFVGRDEWGPLVERAWTVPVGEGIVAGGTVDRVDVFEADRVVSVVDYKTGQRVQTRAELVENAQVGLYAAWAHERWPGWDVWVELHYVAIEEMREPVAIAWTPELEENAKATARALVKRTRAQGDARAWPAKVGPWCAWCEHQERCDAYKAKLSEPLDGPAPDAIEDVIPELARVRLIERLASKRAKAFAERAKQLLDGRVDAKGKATIAGRAVRLRAIPEGIVAAHTRAAHTRLEVGAEAEAEDALVPTEPKLLTAGTTEALPVQPSPFARVTDALIEAHREEEARDIRPRSSSPARKPERAPREGAGEGEGLRGGVPDPRADGGEPEAPGSEPRTIQGVEPGGPAGVVEETVRKSDRTARAGGERPVASVCGCPTDHAVNTDRAFAEGCQRTVDREGSVSGAYVAMTSAAWEALKASEKHGAGSPEHVAAREVVEARKAEWLALDGAERGPRELLGGAALAVHGAGRGSAEDPKPAKKRAPRCKAPMRRPDGRCPTCSRKHPACKGCGAVGVPLVRNGDGAPALCGVCVSKPSPLAAPAAGAP